MSIPIYKDEQAWRAYMLVSQSAIRKTTYELGEMAAAALVIYLISTYSVPVALGFAAILLGSATLRSWQENKNIQNLMLSLENDADLDL